MSDTFLDKTGLSYLWEKIKAYVNKYGTKIHTVTLTPSGWVNKTYTVTVPGISSDSNKQAIDVCAGDRNSSYVWSDSGVWCDEQGENTLTFSCETVPNSNITVNIKFQEVMVSNG